MKPLITFYIIVFCIVTMAFLAAGFYGLDKLREMFHSCSSDERCPVTEKCFKTNCVSSCSKVTCGSNEGCQVNHYHTFSCQCLPKFYRYDMTHECKLPYQWVELTKDHLINATELVPVFENTDSQHIVVRLMGENNVSLLEGIINKNNHTFHGFVGSLENYNSVEVLLIKIGKAKWISSSNGIVVNNAIVAAKIENETVHVCRVGSDPNFYIGLMRPSTKSCNEAHNNTMHSDYDILIHEIYPIQ
ncbi:hypothetical protein PV327_003003 [Microctonus hyperodae]|uniref:Uncharacterized protein n=1 Tax=Microctonus hyperodae TaxID=165561 RepID=A0AA39L0L6_MICHY|nr:hypothetical protein PV327_003003 [Microctonus hyperodae]